MKYNFLKSVLFINGILTFSFLGGHAAQITDVSTTPEIHFFRTGSIKNLTTVKTLCQLRAGDQFTLVDGDGMHDDHPFSVTKVEYSVYGSSPVTPATPGTTLDAVLEEHNLNDFTPKKAVMHSVRSSGSLSTPSTRQCFSIFYDELDKKLSAQVYCRPESFVVGVAKS
ncbi:MAG: hypothetical protein NTX76_03975 [Alphaproteobacteria bacterium]|nr:hypothetical protein [Alphaproteobacteria bacterium]